MSEVHTPGGSGRAVRSPAVGVAGQHSNQMSHPAADHSLAGRNRAEADHTVAVGRNPAGRNPVEADHTVAAGHSLAGRNLVGHRNLAVGRNLADRSLAGHNLAGRGHPGCIGRSRT